MDAVTHIRPTSIYWLWDVAEALGVSLRTLQRAIEAGKLIAVRVGRYTFVTGRSLLAWMEGRSDGKGKSRRKPEEGIQE
jgi:excisionase family DNA binding protein